MHSLSSYLRDFSMKIKSFTFDNLVKFSVEKAKEMLTEVLEAALEEEALESLGVKKKGEHNKDRIGYFNSGYSRTMDTIIGTIKFKRIRVVFKDKSKKFESKIIKKYSRRDSELIYLTLIGYYTGQSCRKMAVLLQKMYGTILSPSGVSRVLKIIDKKRDEFHKRRIEKYYRYIWLDGMYVRVRNIGKFWVLLALGEDEKGKKELIDYRISKREDELSYEEFLENLRERGLRKPLIFVIDGHRGLLSAIQTVFPFSKIQVCVAHKQRDVLNRTSIENREKVSKDLRYVYSSKTKEEAFRRLKEFKSKWKKKEPLAVHSLKYSFSLTLTYLEFDESIQRKIRTNNPMERYIEEIRRRTKPMRIFQNLDSLDRLIYGIIEILNINLGYGIYERANLYFQQN